MQKRILIARLCRLIGEQFGSEGMKKNGKFNLPALDLSPRLRQTLQHLLSGHSEKEVAAKMGLSVHTVHVYVKTLYKHFKVSSRAELLAHCLREETK